MNRTSLQEMITMGEKIDIALREAWDGLPPSIFETVCALNNRFGGHICLGVTDKKEIVGVDPAKVDEIARNFSAMASDPEIVAPPLYLDAEPFGIDGKTVLYIRVREGAHVCRHAGKIWDRAYTRDIDITDHAEKVFQLYARKRTSYYVNRVFLDFGFEALNRDAIAEARDRAAVRNKLHPWKNCSDEALLRREDLITTDPGTNREGLTLAAILLFGNDPFILSALPEYKTDALLRVRDLKRYDDRETVRTNLIHSFRRLVEFGQKHLNDIYLLDWLPKVSARDAILREIVSNTLAHRDYSSRYAAHFIIEEDAITVENGNLPHGFGVLSLATLTPFAKNPPISRVFREIGFTGEPGSGMLETVKSTIRYAGIPPIFEEGDLFKTVIPLSPEATRNHGGKSREARVSPAANYPSSERIKDF